LNISISQEPQNIIEIKENYSSNFYFELSYFITEFLIERELEIKMKFKNEEQNTFEFTDTLENKIENQFQISIENFNDDQEEFNDKKKIRKFSIQLPIVPSSTSIQNNQSLLIPSKTRSFSQNLTNEKEESNIDNLFQLTPRNEEFKKLEIFSTFEKKKLFLNHLKRKNLMSYYQYYIYYENYEKKTISISDRKIYCPKEFKNLFFSKEGKYKIEDLFYFEKQFKKQNESNYYILLLLSHYQLCIYNNQLLLSK